MEEQVTTPRPACWVILQFPDRVEEAELIITSTAEFTGVAVNRSGMLQVIPAGDVYPTRTAALLVLADRLRKQALNKMQLAQKLQDEAEGKK